MNRLSDLFPCSAGLFAPPVSQNRPPQLRTLGLALLLGVLGAPLAFGQSLNGAREIPARFIANRIQVFPVTTAGDTLHLNTDTGGGPPILLRPAVEQLGWPTETVSRGGRTIKTVSFPDFKAGASIPPPHGRNRFLVLPDKGPATFIDADGQLGNTWFAGKVWTFDYGAERLLLHDSTETLSFDPEHTVPLAFQTDSTGAHLRHFPRIEATIADSTYSFLFDTGATFLLSQSAQRVFGGSPKQGGSFVIASVFDHWRSEHPDWRVLKSAGQRGERPLIRVPEVTIAGHTVGPVWFERQPDQGFQQKLAPLMDRSVEGALGGSLFQYFRITVDYPGERAYFQNLD
ncbi:MAG: hypothetical protein ABEL97_02865 [Salinibacter sp.]